MEMAQFGYRQRSNLVCNGGTEPTQQLRMYSLESFNIADMLSCGAEIRQFGLESDCVEEAGEKVVRYLYDRMVTVGGERAAVMVRLFKSLRFDQLDDDLKRYAAKNFDGFADSRHLALMASAGDMPNWNDRRLSKAHRLIPLSNHDLLAQKMPLMS